MTIEDRRHTIQYIQLEELQCGEAFMLAKEQAAGNLLIKTDYTREDTAEITCVNLVTGHVRFIGKNELVYTLRANVVINGETR